MKGISNVCSGDTYTYLGYNWRYITDKEYQENKHLSNTLLLKPTKGRIKLEQYDLLGNLIKIYNTKTDLEKKYNIYFSNLIKMGNIPQTVIMDGFIWNIILNDIILSGKDIYDLNNINNKIIS